MVSVPQKYHGPGVIRLRRLLGAGGSSLGLGCGWMLGDAGWGARMSHRWWTLFCIGRFPRVKTSGGGVLMKARIFGVFVGFSLGSKKTSGQKPTRCP